MPNQPALHSMASAPAPSLAATSADYTAAGAPAFVPSTEHLIKIGKTLASSDKEGGSPLEIFSMTLAQETIPLLPLRNWEQLDIHKWCARGKLPGIPAGLEIGLDHLKIAGETVSLQEPNASQRLEEIFNQWLAFEKGTLEQARSKSRPKPNLAPQSATLRSQPEPLRFHVEADKRGQVHIQCVQGKEQVASIGLSVTGINSLVNQGLMRKPGALKVGALHDWIELDGSLCSFEKGHDDRAKLEQVLNEHDLPSATLGQGKDIVIFTNAASSTGFDIQFPVTVAGVCDNRRRHLAEDALEVLQDPERCGLLQPGRIVKLTRPCLIFKEKTPDGGERYLEKRPENTVIVKGDDDVPKEIDLSRPVNYMHLNAVELTAIFNHPAVNRHSKLQPDTIGSEMQAPGLDSSIGIKPAPTSSPAPPQIVDESLATKEPAAPEPAKPLAAEPVTEKILSTGGGETITQPPEIIAKPAQEPRAMPNQWLGSILAQAPARHDWLASLLYMRLARQFGNSREGSFGAGACWAIALGSTKHIEEPGFKGIFLTEKRGLGFVNGDYFARFNKGVAFIGTHEFAIEGIGIALVGVGLDAGQRVIFVVQSGFRTKFGVPDQTVLATLTRLQEEGAIVLGAQELLQSGEPLEVLWTVPDEQQNPNEPQVLESLKPTVAATSPNE